MTFIYSSCRIFSRGCSISLSEHPLTDYRASTGPTAVYCDYCAKTEYFQCRKDKPVDQDDFEMIKKINRERQDYKQKEDDEDYAFFTFLLLVFDQKFSRLYDQGCAGVILGFISNDSYTYPFEWARKNLDRRDIIRSWNVIEKKHPLAQKSSSNIVISQDILDCDCSLSFKLACEKVLSELTDPYVYLDTYEGYMNFSEQSDVEIYSKAYVAQNIVTDDIIILWNKSSGQILLEKLSFLHFLSQKDQLRFWLVGSKKNATAPSSEFCVNSLETAPSNSEPTSNNDVLKSNNGIDVGINHSTVPCKSFTVEIHIIFYYNYML